MADIEIQICDRLPKLRNYIKGRVGTGEVAEDLYGKAVLKILRKARNDSSGLNTFMWLCAKSVISDYFKTEGLRMRLLNDEYVYCIRTSEPSFEKAYEALEESKIFMEKARNELTAVCRKVLILLLFQNMNHYEIADTLGMHRVTVSGHLMRMRKRLGNVSLNKHRGSRKEN